jgi:hypothetical protein
MFTSTQPTGRLAALAVAAALLVPCAQAAAQGQPRAMPSDYAANAGALPRAMPSDYGTIVESGDYGMPRAMPADYAVGDATSGGSFDWADAGIGAGAAFGLVLVAAGAAVAIRRSSQPAHA